MTWADRFVTACCLAGLVLFGSMGCQKGENPPARGLSPSSSASVAVGATEAPGWKTAMNFIDDLSRCDIDHRGLFFDFGSEDSVLKYGWNITPPQGLVSTRYDGSTWSRVYDKRVRLRFFLPEPSRVFIAMRARGRDASRARVLVDGYSIAALSLNRKRPTVIKTRLTRLPLDAGLHELEIRLGGGRRSSASTDPFAEIDWVRIAGPETDERTYGPPTRFQIVEPRAVIDNIPARAIALRAPSTLRCAMAFPPRARLRFEAGFRGQGSADVEVRLRQDGQPTVVVHRLSVGTSTAQSWQPVDVDLDEYADKIGAIELVVTRSTGTGRLYLAAPRVDVPSRALSKPVKAKRVVLVILSGVQRDDLPPWRGSPATHLPHLTELSQEATVFSNHRGASTSVSAAVASLVSGLPPLSHGVTGTNVSLPEEVVTIGSLARDASLVSAMFTGVPMTSKAFGFSDPWEDYSFFPPNGGRLASAPIDDGSMWLMRQDPASAALTVIHTRGGHPPFELTTDEAKQLPPNDYAGYLGPRRAAQRFSTIKGRPGRLSEADRERLRAMFMVSLAGQDRALGELIRRLSDSNRYDDTLLIVTADVASGRPTLFMDAKPWSENLLALPLYVHFPTGTKAPSHSEAPTDFADVATTIADALGLKLGSDARGQNLLHRAEGVVAPWARLRFSQLGDQYAARSTGFVIHGKWGARPRLCEVSVDPTCAYDRSRTRPLVTDMLFRAMARQLAGRPRLTAPPVRMDSDTASMLKVWGAY